MSQAQSNNTGAQKCVAIADSTLQNSLCVSTQSTVRGAKHFNNAPTTMCFTHHHTGIQQWERNESVLK